MTAFEAGVRSESRHSTATEVRCVVDLLPHPGLAKYARGYSTQDLSILTERGDSAFTDPITITHENVIVEGYAIWQLAKLKQRSTLACIVRQMNSEEALLHLLTRNRGSKGIGEFARILIALELEPWFRERAKSNQRFGGRGKGSSQLAEAERLDVRVEVARAAGVSTGNVSKVKQILQTGIPQIREALLEGEIRINRAAAWAKSPEFVQARHLSDHRNRNGIRRTIHELLRKHQKRNPVLCDGLRDVLQGLRKLHDDPALSSLVADLCGVISQIDNLLCRDEVDRAA